MLEHQELSELCKWPATAKYASFLVLTASNSSLFTPALLRTHSFVFVAVRETRRIFLSPFISKTSRRVYSFFPSASDAPSNATMCDIMWVVVVRWLGSRVVRVLDSGAEAPGFKSQPRCCRVTVLGKLFTPIVPLFTKQQNC